MGTRGAGIDHVAVPGGWAPNTVAGGSGTVAGCWSSDVPVANSGVIHEDDEEDGTAVTPETPTEGKSTTFGGDIDVIRYFLCELGAVRESIVEAGT